MHTQSSPIGRLRLHPSWTEPAASRTFGLWWAQTRNLVTSVLSELRKRERPTPDGETHTTHSTLRIDAHLSIDIFRTSTRVDRAVTGLPTHSTALPSEMDPGRRTQSGCEFTASAPDPLWEKLHALRFCACRSHVPRRMQVPGDSQRPTATSAVLSPCISRAARRLPSGGGRQSGHWSRASPCSSSSAYSRRSSHSQR